MLGEFGDISCWLLISPAQFTRTLIRFLLMESVGRYSGREGWYDLVILFILSKFLIYYYCFICIFHCMRMNLRAMILQGSAGRICHLENVKSYFSYLQQCTKIIKMLTFKAYFSQIRSYLKRIRSQITSNLYVSNWKS